jgi:hypothetical protein
MTGRWGGAMTAWRPIALALAGVAVVIAAVLLAPWSPPTRDIAAERLASPGLSARHPRDVDAWQATSLARPLFNRGRRPPATGQLAAAAPPAPAPRLTGVLVGPFGASAVFVVSGADKPVTVQEGDQMGTYRIRRITPGEVRVDSPDGPLILRPSFGGSAPDRQPAPDQRAAWQRSRLASRP